MIPGHGTCGRAGRYQAELLWMKGEAPLGRRKVQGCAFLGVMPRNPDQGAWGIGAVLGSLPVPARAPGGLGVPFSPQEGGCSGRVLQPAGWELAEKQVGDPCSAGIVPASCPAWNKGRTGIEALGEHPGEQAPVLQHQGRRQKLETPKQLCLEVLGRNSGGNRTLVPSSSQLARLGDAAPACPLVPQELRVPGMGQCPGFLVGSEWFGDPCVQSSALGQHYTLSRGRSWPLHARVGRPMGQESGPGNKSSTQRFEEGKDLPGLQLSGQCTQGQSKMRCMVQRQLETVPAMTGGFRGHKKVLKLCMS